MMIQFRNKAIDLAAQAKVHTDNQNAEGVNVIEAALIEAYNAGLTVAHGFVMEARLGEADQDFRSILHRINAQKS